MLPRQGDQPLYLIHQPVRFMSAFMSEDWGDGAVAGAMDDAAHHRAVGRPYLVHRLNGP